MDQALAGRLRSAGLDPAHVENPDAAWHALFEAEGRRAGIEERYALEAAVRGTAVDDLAADLRRDLALEVLRAHVPGFEQLPEEGDPRATEPIVVMTYDPTWPDLYMQWRRRIELVLGTVARRIEHVGSTAVPGMVAKPIIDIQVSVENVDNEAAYVPALESLDLRLRSRDDAHRYFRPPPGRPREVQVHVCGPGSEWERVHLEFRDRLRQDPDAARAYGELKHQLAERHRDDRLAYADAKSSFIRQVLASSEPPR